MKRKRTEKRRKGKNAQSKIRGGIASPKVPFIAFPSLLQTLRALSSSLRSANSYVRRRFRVIGAITHPVFRQRTKTAAAVTASRYRRANSHSVGSPVYGVTSILRYGGCCTGYIYLGGMLSRCRPSHYRDAFFRRNFIVIVLVSVLWNQIRSLY